MASTTSSISNLVAFSIRFPPLSLSRFSSICQLGMEYLVKLVGLFDEWNVTAAGGSYEEVVIDDCGHVPFIEKPDEFDRVFHAQLAIG